MDIHGAAWSSMGLHRCLAGRLACQMSGRSARYPAGQLDASLAASWSAGCQTLAWSWPWPIGQLCCVNKLVFLCTTGEQEQTRMYHRKNRQSWALHNINWAVLMVGRASTRKRVRTKIACIFSLIFIKDVRFDKDRSKQIVNNNRKWVPLLHCKPFTQASPQISSSPGLQ